MSTLDEKLDYILKSNGAVQRCFDKASLDDYDKLIPAIKQAFIDEGWITPEQVKKTQELVNQMAQTAQDMAKLPVTVREVGTMTGPEWLARFEKELGNPNYTTVNGIHGEPPESIEVYKPGKVMTAAQRAAGVEE